MDQKDIFEMIICEMTERALEVRRKNCDECEQQFYMQVAELSKQKEKVLAKLTSEERQVLEDYIVKSNLIAQHECEHLKIVC